MSVVEEVRSAIQDVLAPDIKAIQARLDAIEQRMERLEKQYDRYEDRLDKFEARIDQRFDQVMAGIQTVIQFNTLEQRLRALETKQMTS